MAVQNGTTPRQRHVVAPLDRIAEAVAPLRDASGPVLFIIGSVVARAGSSEVPHVRMPALA
jgi:siroheme synthase